MRIEDEDENLIGYDFPVTIYKGRSEYQVHNLESLEYHLLQGWTIEKPELVEEPAPPALLTESSLDDLRKEVADLRKALTEFTDVISVDMIKGQGQLLASFQGRLSKLEKVSGVTRRSGPPILPDVPGLPPQG